MCPFAHPAPQAIRLLLAVGLLALSGCLSTKGPRLALPSQDLGAAAPSDSVRVVFINDSNDLAYALTGDTQVEIDGEILPTIGRDEYVQAFLAPGTYDLVLRHWDAIRFTDRYTLVVDGEEAVFLVWNRPFSTKYERTNLPVYVIEERYRPVAVPEGWAANE